MNPVKICCVWVEGHVDYPINYVTRLQSMVARFAPPHQFYCLTDRPGRLPRGVEPIETRRLRKSDGFAWWKKLELFAAGELAHGRILYLDLDVLVVAPLAPIIEQEYNFALIEHEGNFRPSTGHRVVHQFNSSCMVWNGHERACLFEDWRPEVTKILWGDQDWIGQQMPWARAMPKEWFPRLSSILERAPITPSVKVEKPPIPRQAKVILCKKPKNSIAAASMPWFEKMWS